MPKDADPNAQSEDPSAKPELLEHPSYEELMQKLEEAEQKGHQHWERILRMQAENENVLRRTERDIANAHKYALEKFATDLLPIVDSLELAISSVPPEMQKASAPVIEGVNLTLKMFYGIMEKYGIKQVDPINQPFNPEFEQAISVEHNDKVKPNTVVSVLQKGYTLNNRLLRPALVIVAKAKE